MKKEAMNLKVSKEGLMGGFGSGRKKDRRYLDYYLIISKN